MICRSRKRETTVASTRPITAPVTIALILCIVNSVSGYYDIRRKTGEGQVPVCKPGLFDCEDATGCISASWVCDGELDCQNGLDERQGCCAEGKQFECQSDGLCIDLKFQCDSFSDCKDSSDERNCSSCSDPSLFHCHNDRCVDPVFMCDQDNDCGDFSDELGCDPQHPGTYFCQNMERYVTRDQLCNGVNDCGDMSDEVGCEPCEAFHFHCMKEGGCVLMFDLCDGENDCLDGTDESWCDECTKAGQFTCRNGKCVDQNLVCNKQNDCGDDSDEQVCSCKPGSEFHCDSGLHEIYNITNTVNYCIPNDWLCDDMNDCNEGEDENAALCEQMRGKLEQSQCGEHEFECADKTCIANSEVCNGIDNCAMGEDEIGCPESCPRGTYQLCLTSEECISYDQFCDGNADCMDHSDESFTNGYCFCSGIMCGNKCVPISKICDSTWDCKHGEDEQECAQCKPNLHDTTTLSDQAVFVSSLIKTTYTQMDSFQIYFAALVDKWVTLFGEDDSSPFHMNVEAHDADAQELVHEAQDFLISIVALRPTLRQFMAVMNELRFTDEKLPTYDHSQTLNEEIPRAKRYIIERSSSSEVYEELMARCTYLRQKSVDAVQILSSITKMLHYDFATCRDSDYPLYQDESTHEHYDDGDFHKRKGPGTVFEPRSMRDVFTALTLVQNQAPRENVNGFLDKLYDLDNQLRQLIVSVQKFDFIISSVAFLIDDARERLEFLIMEDELATEVVNEKRDYIVKRAIRSTLDTGAKDVNGFKYKGRK